MRFLPMLTTAAGETVYMPVRQALPTGGREQILGNRPGGEINAVIGTSWPTSLPASDQMAWRSRAIAASNRSEIVAPLAAHQNAVLPHGIDLHPHDGHRLEAQKSLFANKAFDLVMLDIDQKLRQFAQFFRRFQVNHQLLMQLTLSNLCWFTISHDKRLQPYCYFSLDINYPPTRGDRSIAGGKKLPKMWPVSDWDDAMGSGHCVQH
jgi:hypothetical protein